MLVIPRKSTALKLLRLDKVLRQSLRLKYLIALLPAVKNLSRQKNHFEENPIANIPTESITDMRVEKGDGGSNSVFINGVQVRLRTNGYVPLEIK